MSTIIINKTEFFKLLGKKLSDKEIEEKISMMGVSVEDIRENEFDLEVFPNRPDLLSTYGLARFVSVFLGISKKLKSYNAKKSDYIINVENPIAEWPYTATAVVKGLKLNNEKIKEIINIQEKLSTTLLRNRKKGGIGIYPLDKIKFPVKFTAAFPDKINYKPLECNKILSANEILKEHPIGKAYNHIVKDWKKLPLFIDSNNNIMSMPPIVNSHDMGKIDENTTNVFIESTGIDFKTINIALNIIVSAISDMGGEIYQTKLIYKNKTYYTPDFKPNEIKLNVDYVNKNLGLELKQKEVISLLQKMSYNTKKLKNDIIILVPAYRYDIIHPIDLVEDIAIAYGFDNILPKIKPIATIGEESESEILRRKISNLLIGLKYLEVHPYNLINLEAQTNLMNVKLNCVKLANSLSQEYNSLRTWILPSLINILKENKHNEYPQNIFCSGSVFKYDNNKDTGIREDLYVSLLACHSSANFTEIKQILDYLSNCFSFNYEIEEKEHGSFISGRSGVIIINKKEVGIIGEINPKVLENFGLEMPVAALELNLEELFCL